MIDTWPNLVWDDPELLDDNEEVPKLDGVVGGSIPGCDIVYLLDGKLKASLVFQKQNKKKMTHGKTWGKNNCFWLK